jgi:DNA segregation ATPase FtsK/SpoIIIE-like protein
MCCNCRRELDAWFSAKVAKMVYDIGMQGFRCRTHTEMIKEYQSVFNAFVEYKKRRGGSQRREEAIQLKIDGLATSPTTTKKEVPRPDPLLDAARQLAREHKHISTSFLQRRLSIGYPRAARIMEQLEGKALKREGRKLG